MFVVNLLEIFQNLYSLLLQKIQTNPLTRTWQNMMDTIDYTESTFWDTAKKIFNLALLLIVEMLTESVWVDFLSKVLFNKL